MYKLSFSLLACLSISLTACGTVVPLADGDGGALVDGGNSNGDGGDSLADADIIKPACEGPIAFEDLTGCLVAAQCEQFVRCSPLFPTVEECIELLPSVFGDFDEQLAIFGFGIEAGKINYDADAAVACLASFSNSTCDSDGGEDACEPVFRGDTQSGANCLEDQECAIIGSDCSKNNGPGMNCDDTVQCCLGFCEAPVGIGQSCNIARCEPGAHCVRDANNATICQPGDAGSPCEQDFECDTDFFCGFEQGGAGQCQPTRPTDAQCGNSNECSGDDECVVGNCSAVDTAGSACQGSCIGSLGCINGQCESLPGLGDNCSAFGQCNSFNLDCFGAGGAQTCVEKQGLNQPCVARQCDPQFICEDDLPNPPMLPTCVERLSVGETCEGSSQCSDSFCVFNAQAGQSFCGEAFNCYEAAGL